MECICWACTEAAAGGEAQQREKQHNENSQFTAPLQWDRGGEEKARKRQEKLVGQGEKKIKKKN